MATPPNSFVFASIICFCPSQFLLTVTFGPCTGHVFKGKEYIMNCSLPLHTYFLPINLNDITDRPEGYYYIFVITLPRNL